MTPCSTWAISVIETVSITEIVEGTWSPWRLKFTTNRNPVAGEMSIVAGKSPAVASPTSRSVPVSNLWTVPQGIPWAIDTYQWRPSGETRTPCGPSISFGRIPTGMRRTSSPPSGPKRTRSTVSSDSAAT